MFRNLKLFLISYIKKYINFSITNKRYKGKYLVRQNRGFTFAFNLDSFFSFHLRPKKAQLINCAIDTNKELDKICIIIQGQIIQSEEFTLETIKVYKYLFPRVNIILSTWNDENTKKIEDFSFKNFYIIKSRKPTEAGELNINFQIKTMQKALKLINSIDNIKFITKTRSDCRIYDPFALTNLLNLINNFPVKKNNFLSYRIIGNSASTCKFRVYGLTDVFQFASKNDMINYWDISYYNQVLQDKNFNLNNEPIIKDTPLISEILLCSYFLYKNKVSLKWDLEHWWEVCSNYFMVVDDKLIDLYWHKHSPEIEFKFLKSYSENYPRSLNFHDWLKLYFRNYDDWKTISNKEKWKFENGKFIQISC